jgi:hypothetical protein
MGQAKIEERNGRYPAQTEKVVVTSSPKKDSACTCSQADLNKPATVAEVAPLVEALQEAWTARWGAIQMVEDLLKEHGFETVGKDEEINWVVSEYIYRLVSEKFEDDYGPVENVPDFPIAVERLVNDPRLTGADLAFEQFNKATMLLAGAYAKHISFMKPMNALLYGYVHNHIGCFGGVSDVDMEEIFEFMWECRHIATTESGRDYEMKANQDFVDLINKIQEETAAAVGD